MKDAGNSRLEWVLDLLRQRGLKLTKPRLQIVRGLAEAVVPVSLRHLAGVPEIRGRCDQATVYRTLMCLVEHGAARELRLTNRSAHYVLTPPGAPHDYLICERCGVVVDVPCEAELHMLAHRVSSGRGFVASRHQFEVFGVCGQCASAARERKPAGTAAAGCACCHPNLIPSQEDGREPGRIST